MSLTKKETVDAIKERKIIDGHIHIQHWFDGNGNNFINGVEWYKKEFGMQSISLAAMPCAYRDVTQNFMCLLYRN